MKKNLVVFALFAVLIFIVSCGGDGSKKLVEGGESEKKAGELGGECYGNGTCNAGLICDDESNTCVEDPDTPSEQTDDNVDTSSEQNDDNPDSGEPSEDPNAPQTPCNPNPCLNVANSTKECIETGDTTYSCKCNSGYNWTGSLCQSNSTPSLPECSASNTGPCYDSTSHLTWSKKADTTYDWSDAGTYCDNLTEGGYSDWRLPNISELRTLIQNCSETQMPGGSCGVIDTGNSSTSCLSSSCWTESACYSCSSDSTGWHSKFGDTGWFWSSSTLSDRTGYAWSVYFNGGSVYGRSNYADYYVRCVR